MQPLALDATRYIHPKITAKAIKQLVYTQLGAAAEILGALPHRFVFDATLRIADFCFVCVESGYGGERGDGGGDGDGGERGEEGVMGWRAGVCAFRGEGKGEGAGRGGGRGAKAGMRV